MKKMLILLTVLMSTVAAEAQTPSINGFVECARVWVAKHGNNYERYKPEQFRKIADNIVAYQNPDGGWPRDIDVMAMLNPDSIRQCIATEHLSSSFVNRNIYPQVEYLSTVFYLTGDSTYCHSAQRGMDYILATQQPNGGWQQSPLAPVSFTDGVLINVLTMWIGVEQDDPVYAWSGEALKARVRESLDRGVALVLRCQQARGGAKIAWPEQCVGRKPGPMQPIAHKPSSMAVLSSSEIVLMLMKLNNPSSEIIESVQAAVKWLGSQHPEVLGIRGMAAVGEYPKWLTRIAKQAREAAREERKAAQKAARESRKVARNTQK